jgi:hypothetical protein
MSTLQIGQLKCHEETDEVGSDDIYFVVGIGRRSASSKKGEIKVITSSNWRDLESGDPLRTQDVTIDPAFNSQDFYTITMVERDNGRDIAGGHLKVVTDKFASLWQSWGVNVQGLNDNQIFDHMRHGLNQVIGGAGNDELVGSTQLLHKPSPGKNTDMVFKGDGGKYQVWFKVV